MTTCDARESAEATAAKAQEEIKPGIYPGVPFDEYARWPGVSQSWLKNFIRKTPAHALWQMTHPEEEKPCYRVGSIAHLSILEPELLDDSVLIVEAPDKRFKAYKDAVAANPDKWVVLPSEIEPFQLMHSAVWRHPVARRLLESSEREVSMVWIDPETGIRCKGRADVLATLDGATVLSDLKTCREAGRDVFQRALWNYGYHVQFGFYSDGLEILTGKRPDHCAIIPVENQPPFEAAVHFLDPRAIEAGRRDYRAALETAARCLRENNFPGYDVTAEPLDLPRFVRWRYPDIYPNQAATGPAEDYFADGGFDQ